jgi:sugar/nucleoside kinase (ribokinase family)
VISRTPGGGNDTFVCAAYPLEEVTDPTGAGDAFAGGVMGLLAASRDYELSSLRRAVATGAVLASFNVEGFGPYGLEQIDLAAVEKRLDAVRAMVALPDR